MKRFLIILSLVTIFFGCKDLESSNKYEAILSEYEQFADSIDTNISSSKLSLEKTTQISARNKGIVDNWNKLVGEAQDEEHKPSLKQLEEFAKYSQRITDKLIDGL